MTIVLWIAAVLIAVAALLGILRLATAQDDATRAAVSDLVYFCAVATLALLGSVAGITVILDVIVLASLVGILATVALARILTRGRR